MEEERRREGRGGEIDLKREKSIVYDIIRYNNNICIII